MAYHYQPAGFLNSPWVSFIVAGNRITLRPKELGFVAPLGMTLAGLGKQLAGALVIKAFCPNPLYQTSMREYSLA
jgi:hypothetical protein